jgi:hypothetical protein
LLNVVIHVAAWSAFLIPLYLLMTSNLRTPNEEALLQNPFFIFNQVFTYGFLVAFYYFNSLFLIPRLLVRKQIWLYALIVVAALALYLYVPEYVFRNYIFHRPTPPPGIPPPNANPGRRRFRLLSYLGSSGLFLLVFVVSFASKILQQWFLAERQKEKAEKETLRTELSLLKSQVNPHFLFNTLNNIYAMAITESEHTADAVMKLSQIMRYILHEAEHETVPLQKDLEFLQRYIDLQKFRLSEKVTLDYRVQGDGQLLRIAPLLMIPFVENAFKYGVSTREKSHIGIDIRIRENVVTLYVENTKHALSAAATMDNTGIGINNARRRLALLYPGRHELTISDDTARFVVSLKIVCS